MAKPLPSPGLPTSPSLVFLKPSSQATAASLKSSLYVRLHLDRQWSPSAGLCRLAEAKRMEVNLAGKCASQRGMVSSFPTLSQSRTVRLCEDKGPGWVSNLFSKKVFLQALMVTV